MKVIRNPNYKSAGVVKAEKAAMKLTQLINNLPSNVKYISFDDIRDTVDAANLAGITGKDLPDGMIEHIASLGGHEVTNDF